MSLDERVIIRSSQCPDTCAEKLTCFTSPKVSRSSKNLQVSAFSGSSMCRLKSPAMTSTSGYRDT